LTSDVIEHTIEYMESLEDFVALSDVYGPKEARARIDEYAEVCAPGRAEAERLSGLPPGPELVHGLVAIKGMLLDRHSEVLVRGCWERVASWSAAQAMGHLIGVAGQPGTDLAAMSIPDIAQHTGLSEIAIGMQLAQAWHTRDALPATWEALNAGRITQSHARVMHQVTYRVDDAITRTVEQAVLAQAIGRGWKPGTLADAARKMVLRLDPDGAAKRAAAAKKSADVTVRPDDDEMATVNAYGDAFTARQMMDELNHRADAMRRAGDERSVGERRLGALAKAVLGDDTTLDEPTPAGTVAEPLVSEPVAEPVGGGRRPKRATALLLVSLSTLLGGSGPGYLDGYGPITAETARKIAAKDLLFRRLVFDELTGKPVELSVDRYALSEEMRRWVDVRDRCCLFPGCNRRAVYCDADHAVEYPEGQTTCDNCGLLCRKHHNLKTKKWWKLRRNADDSCDWQSPLGFTYHRPASTYEEFLDDPDPPDPLQPLRDVDTSDPDPPDDDLPWPAFAPPPQDQRDVDYDAIASYLHGSKTWQPVS
jgi:hypothetical protein